MARVLFRPVDIAALAAFRVLFGVLMFVAVVRYFTHGWIDEFFLRPEVWFPYPGFAWLPVPGAAWGEVPFFVLGACALCIAVGFRFRAAAATFCLIFTWLQLIDRTNYLNHYYLISLVSGLIAMMPLGGCCAVDAWLRPHLRRDTVPAWMPGLLRFQIGVVYVFAGLAKIDGDWLFAAQPLRIWLATAGDVPLLGPVLEPVWIAFAFSWAGMLFDLTIPFFLLCRRTRVPAYLAVLLFHSVTGWLFPIGLFPVVMVAFTTLFFEADWPRRVALALRLPLPVANAGATGFDAARDDSCHRRATVAFVILWVGVQVLVPLRFLAWPGCVNWTEDGFRFAWRVMLIEKYAEARFRVVDRATREVSTVDPDAILTPQQARMMSTQPDMILHFAHWLAEDARRSGRDVAVHADVRLAFNGRPSRPFVDPARDLAAVDRRAPSASWLAAPCPDS